MTHAHQSASGFTGGAALLAALLVGCALLGGCATAPLHDGRIDRLSPEQVAALAKSGDPARAGEAARLTEQADRDAAQARARQAQVERERAREIQRQREWDLRYGPRGYWSFGLGYPYGPYGPRRPGSFWRYRF